MNLYICCPFRRGWRTLTGRCSASWRARSATPCPPSSSPPSPPPRPSTPTRCPTSRRCACSGCSPAPPCSPTSLSCCSSCLPSSCSASSRWVRVTWTSAGGGWRAGLAWCRASCSAASGACRAAYSVRAFFHSFSSATGVLARK